MALSWFVGFDVGAEALGYSQRTFRLMQFAQCGFDSSHCKPNQHCCGDERKGVCREWAKLMSFKDLGVAGQTWPARCHQLPIAPNKGSRTLMRLVLQFMHPALDFRWLFLVIRVRFPPRSFGSCEDDAGEEWCELSLVVDAGVTSDSGDSCCMFVLCS